MRSGFEGPFPGPSGRMRAAKENLNRAVFRRDLREVELNNLLAVQPPSGIFQPVPRDTVLNQFDPTKVNTHVVRDLQLLAGDQVDAEGARPDDYKALQSEFVIKMLEGWGYDSKTVLSLPEGKKFKLARKITKRLHELSEEKIKLQQQAAGLDSKIEYYEGDIRETARRIELPFTMERPQGSSLHHMAQFLKSVDGDTEIVRDVEAGLWQSFVIEHDWAAAFHGAQDFDQGEFPLPYDCTCFELRVNGLRVIMLMGVDGELGMIGNMIIGVNGRWYLNADQFRFSGGKIHSIKLAKEIEPWRGHAERFLNKLAEQIRAVCIMLDAQVAEREVIRASERLNEQRRRKGQSLLRDYHVVSLARRHRAKPMGDHVVTPGTKKRLHFRRGHWRHYAEHRTWINWMLVGDPDLGFVDKHYKL